MDKRDTPAIYCSCSEGLLRVIGNVWTKAIDYPAEVVVGASDEIPLLHVRFESVVDRCETSVEETTAEVTKVDIPCVLPSACGNGLNECEQQHINKHMICYLLGSEETQSGQVHPCVLVKSGCARCQPRDRQGGMLVDPLQPRQLFCQSQG